MDFDWFPIVACIVLVFAGIVSLAFSLAGLRKARSAAHWIETSGTVVYSAVEVESAGEDPSYRAVVEYEYPCSGGSYVSRRISFFDMPTSRSSAEKKCHKYPAGSRVSVRYDSEYPAEAVLEPGATFPMYFLLAFGAFFVLSGTLFLLLFLVS